MFDFLKKNKDKKNGVIFHKKTDPPPTCGGTDSYRDADAVSEVPLSRMTFFFAESKVDSRLDSRKYEDLWFVSAYAAPANGGTFVFLEKKRGYVDGKKRDISFALIKEDIFPSLEEFVKESGIVKKNGFHSTTHGLPENFGGSVEILYENGEKISFSDNQAPILDYKTGCVIEELFINALGKEKQSVPDVSELIRIDFFSTRNDRSYTKAAMTLNSDGTATVAKEEKFDSDSDKVFTSEKQMSKETVDSIKNNIKETGLFAWRFLPDNGFTIREKSKLVFVFKDGSSFEVEDGKKVPDQIRGGFFNVRLEITVKN